MGNMSYCRFRNTLDDLLDCQENMDDPDLGEEEKRARRRLIQIASDITDDYGYELDDE